MRKPWRFYSLSRPKLRQSWNKFNLYNIARAAAREPLVNGRATFFQQKWAAKSKTRGYHGEHIPEKKWVRLFSRRLLSAVDMPPEYLAANDGAEQAAGRGSGLSTSTITAENYSRVPKPSRNQRNLTHPGQRTSGFGDVNAMLSEHHKDMTPYMQMTFAPIERRLDTAVFRALFASSVRQARQFVIHGAVKVNGKKMVHPSYQLNPGDMFQVDIEKVMYGTGVQKPPKAIASLKDSIDARKRREEKELERHQKSKGTAPGNAKAAEADAPEGEAAEAEAEAETEVKLSEEDELHNQNSRLRRLRRGAREILRGDVKNLSAKQKQELRLFRATAQRFLSLPEGSKLSASELVDKLQDQIGSLNSIRAFKKADSGDKGTEDLSGKEAEAEELTPEQEVHAAKRKEFQKRVLEKGLEGLTSIKDRAWAENIIATHAFTNEEIRRLALALKADEENPIDESKPYLTPWQPRPYMSAFAFIPRYLEVNPNICAAVYLRHPVARKGMAEVPTPFNYLTSQLAHNWYLGRG